MMVGAIIAMTVFVMVEETTLMAEEKMD